MPPSSRWLMHLLVATLSIWMAACATPRTVVREVPKPANKPPLQEKPLTSLQAEGAAREVVMYALGLLDVGYQFGGKNPEAGLDCSGMVVFIYKEAVGMDLPRSAAEIAKKARPVARSALKAGDLVFFDTRGFAYSHVGLYLGDDKFIHAPSSKGRVRVEQLSSPYYAQRFLGGRSLL